MLSPVSACEGTNPIPEGSHDLITSQRHLGRGSQHMNSGGTIQLITIASNGIILRPLAMLVSVIYKLFCPVHKTVTEG